MKYLLYGANGYTAQLIIEEGLKRGQKLIVAGRTKSKIKEVADKYDLPMRIFDLENRHEISSHLHDIYCVLNAAGPFNKTAEAFSKACLNAKIHYLDITGEIEVFEFQKSLDEEAKSQGIMLLPGVGFDVVPTDCMSAYLAEKLPEALHLELAFTSEGSGMSHGTASTAVSQLGESGAVREGGQIVSKPIAHKSKTIDFGAVTRTVATIPWGDISTAFTSTGIPNIEVYTSMPKSAIRFMKLSWLTNPIMRSSFVKKIAQKWVDKNLEGPNKEQNRVGYSLIYGRVKTATDEKEAMAQDS